MKNLILLMALIFGQQILGFDQGDSEYLEYLQVAEELDIVAEEINKGTIELGSCTLEFLETYQDAQVIEKENLYKFIKLTYLAKVLITYNHLLTLIDMDEVEIFNRSENLNKIIEFLNSKLAEFQVNYLYGLAKKGIEVMEENYDDKAVGFFLKLRISYDPTDEVTHFDFSFPTFL